MNMDHVQSPIHYCSRWSSSPEFKEANLLDTFFEPKSVAIVGASASPDKLGHVVLKNAIDSGFKGKVFPINPKAGTILGLQAYSSVSACPETPDLAVVVIPYTLVPEAIR